MAKTFRLVRDLSDEEKSFMRNVDAAGLRAGDVVYEYTGHTYGCIREPDVALCLAQDGPFFGLPRAAVEEVAAGVRPEAEPAELTEPLDVVAWLRALPVQTVLLDRYNDAWQLQALHHRYWMCIDGNFNTRLDNADGLAQMTGWGPFRVLWTPPQDGGE